ncbi:unnamed protein product [Didymodactylos carnosus]|nr:unnamed protein product [Didymodactylos carnosus]CAF3797246.1 unnamed protein product [Didymodactylos carnosus]
MGPLIQRPPSTMPRHPVHSYQTPMADPTLRWQVARPLDKLANMVASTNPSLSIPPRWPTPGVPPSTPLQTMNGHNSSHITTTLPPSPMYNEQPTFTLLQNSHPQGYPQPGWIPPYNAYSQIAPNQSQSQPWNGQTFSPYPYQQPPLSIPQQQQQQFSNQHLYPVNELQTAPHNYNLYNLNPVPPTALLPSPITTSPNFPSPPSHNIQTLLKTVRPIEQVVTDTKQEPSPIILTELLKNDKLANNIKESVEQTPPLNVEDGTKFMIGDIIKGNILTDT